MAVIGTSFHPQRTLALVARSSQAATQFAAVPGTRRLCAAMAAEAVGSLRIMTYPRGTDREMATFCNEIRQALICRCWSLVNDTRFHQHETHMIEQLHLRSCADDRQASLTGFELR